MANNETVEQFISRGGEITKCKTRGIRKHSSCPGLYLPPKKEKKKGVDAQQLLDAATGTQHEAEVIAFLESNGYEVN